MRRRPPHLGPSDPLHRSAPQQAPVGRLCHCGACASGQRVRLHLATVVDQHSLVVLARGECSGGGADGCIPGGGGRDSNIGRAKKERGKQLPNLAQY